MLSWLLGRSTVSTGELPREAQELQETLEQIRQLSSELEITNSALREVINRNVLGE